MNRLIAVVLVTLVCGCGAWRGGKAYPLPADLEVAASDVDLSGIQRDGVNTDVIGDYWGRAFGALGEGDTFELFRRKYRLLAAENQIEADAALRGFRRLCKLRGNLDDFDRFWAAAG